MALRIPRKDELKKYMPDKDKEVIYGIKAIAAYMDRHPNTIRNWMQRHAFPASKMPNGWFITTKSLINQWIVAGHKIEMQDRYDLPMEDIYRENEMDQYLLDKENNEVINA